MDIKELQDKLNSVEQQVAEKENELQLLKEDLEAMRAALEAHLEETGSSESPEPTSRSAPKMEALPAEEPESKEEVAKEEPKPEKSPEEQHEAIIRTIEEFSKQRSGARPAYDGPIGDRKTVGESAGRTKLNDLKKAIGINERFLYANELFGGDMSAFTQAVEELNHVESLHDATRLMDENLAVKFHWDDESETVEAFKTLVSRRFG